MLVHDRVNDVGTAVASARATGSVPAVTDPVDLGPTPGAPLTVPPAVAGPAAPLPPAARRRSGRLLTALVLVVGAVAAWRVRSTLGDAVVALADLDGRTLTVLAACWVAMLVARSSVYRWSHPDARLAHGLVLDQVNLATGNALPGGVAVGYAARYRIGRSFGQTPHGVSLTMLSASHAFSLGRWLLVLAVAGSTLVAGRGTEVDVVLLAAGFGFVVVSAVGWAVLAHDCRTTRWLVPRAQAGMDRLGRRFGRARDVPIVPFVDGLRADARRLVGERGWRVVLAGVAAAVGEAAILLVVVRALDVTGTPATVELLRAYVLARVASSFVPTPGNVGALEGALAAGLVAAGADPAAALAGVLVFRGLTFALPIATGAAAYGAWQRWERRRPDPRREDPVPAELAPAEVRAPVAALGTFGEWHHGPAAGAAPATAEGGPCSTSATPIASASSRSTDRTR